MPSKEAGARGVQVAVPPLSGHAPHTIEAPGAYRMAPAPHPCVPLSLRLVWVSVQALQPPRALGPWGPPVPGLRGRALSWSCPPRRRRPVCWGLWSIWGDTARASSMLSAAAVSRPHGCAIGVWAWAGRAMAPETVLDRAHAYSGGTGGSADGPSSRTFDHSAGRWWDRCLVHRACPRARANAMNIKIDK
jgi:hypothetical protein